MGLWSHQRLFLCFLRIAGISPQSWKCQFNSGGLTVLSCRLVIVIIRCLYGNMPSYGNMAVLVFWVLLGYCELQHYNVLWSKRGKRKEPLLWPKSGYFSAKSSSTGQGVWLQKGRRPDFGAFLFLKWFKCRPWYPWVSIFMGCSRTEAWRILGSEYIQYITFNTLSSVVRTSWQFNVHLIKNNYMVSFVK